MPVPGAADFDSRPVVVATSRGVTLTPVRLVPTIPSATPLRGQPFLPATLRINDNSVVADWTISIARPWQSPLRINRSALTIGRLDVSRWQWHPTLAFGQVAIHHAVSIGYGI